MSDIDPADHASVRPARPFSDEESADDSSSEITTPKKGEREGLPPGYRMRADAHYVDVLTSRRAERSESRSAKRGELSDVEAGPRDRREVRDTRERVDRLFAQLAEDVATIESAAALLSGEPSRMARRANVDVIRAQAWRASCLLRTTNLVEGRHRLQVRPRPLGFMLGQLRTGFASEARLTGTTVDIHTSDWNAVVAVDEQAIMAGIAGGVIATLGLLDQTDDAVIRVSAATAGHELRAIDISQDELAVTPGMSGRFFDASWTDRPGGWMAGLGAAAAKAAVELHGGEAAFLVAERFGSVLRLTFPAKA